jgi:hypothetical protein
MRSLLNTIAAMIRGVPRSLASLLPSPPSDAPPRPDIDGRRPDAADPVEVLHANQGGKEGRGGFR